MGNEDWETDTKRASHAVPAWVPVDVRNYVFHTEMGQPIWVLARSQSCHASTIMRQIRKVETRRDDPLVDREIKELAAENSETPRPSNLEMMQALRRLAMPGTILAIAMGMEQGVILQDSNQGEADHGSKLPSVTAMMLAPRGWIAGGQTVGRVLHYRITPAGRVALRELMAQTENRARAMAEGPTAFEGAASGVGTWMGGPDDKPIIARMVLQESPVVALSRRKGRDGNPFLSRTMVRAAKRLREDYELAHVGKIRGDKAVPDLQDVLALIETYRQIYTTRKGAAPQVRAALVFLGPGLSEVALRGCCLPEGLEITESTWVGWRGLAKLCCASRSNGWGCTMRTAVNLAHELVESMG